MPDTVKTTYVSWLGCRAYLPTLDLQMQICAMKKGRLTEDVLLLLEHPPTITLGRNGNWQNLIVSDETLKSRGVTRYEVDRGGDITFHGLGQLVGYPILQLEKPERDVHRYMRNLEQSLIRVLASYGIEGQLNSQYTGVWTAQGKIASMGVHISKWMTRHGFALNVNTDLSFYKMIVPCGIVGKSVSSIQSILHHPVDLKEVAVRYAAEFGAIFDRQLTWIPEIGLRETLEHHAPDIPVA